MQRTLDLKYPAKYLSALLLAAGAALTVAALAVDLPGLVGLRGFGANQFALALSGLGVCLAGLLVNSSGHWRRLVEWLVLGLAVVAACFAADLVVVNGLPGPAAKGLVLVSIGLAVVLTGAMPDTPSESRAIRQWFQSLMAERIPLLKFASLTLQLGLLTLVIGHFRLENQAFYANLALLVLYGYLFHYFLPARHRLTFFVLLSMAAVLGILGLGNGTLLISLGLVLIGLCHLPISSGARTAALLAVGGVLTALRARWIAAPWLEVIWPVLASMFMFRLIIYVYDLKHGKAPPTLASTLAYFFLLPNVVSPFFPVVDYGTFRRTYYDEEQHQIYQKGLVWMLWGVLHLLAYRLINYYLMIAAVEVTNTTELVRYLVANFGLYVRVSGQFHLIIGMLHLFGFNLPTTHHAYFLAANFTDLWRRINIYWKDFMLKVFYYPTLFRIRHWGPLTSLCAATLFVFLLTWFFHAYQWFWLRGSFLLTAPDMLFWLILAVLVVVNTLYEARRGRQRTLGERTLAPRAMVLQALRAAGTYAIMAVLWALWSSGSIGEWVELLSVVRPTAADLGLLVLSFVGIVLVFTAAIWLGQRQAPAGRRAPAPNAWLRSAVATGGAALVLLAISSPVVARSLGGRFAAFASDLTANRLSDREAALLQQGYYEDLAAVDRFNSQLWDIYMKRPSDWPSIIETAAVRPAGDDLIHELAPSTELFVHGVQLSINRWGMRDQDYALMPAPGTYRIALTGPSFVMGLGVAQADVFEWQLEARLNRERAGAPYDRYEILNFAVPGYSAVQDLMLLEQKALSFQPDALFFMAHQREESAVTLYLADRLSAGVTLGYEELMQMAWDAGAVIGASKTETVRQLQPIETELLAWTYRQIVEVSRANGVVPVWVFMPTLEYPMQPEVVARLTGLAREAGFVVVDLSNAYADQDLEALVVAYWDKHPNAEGHRLIAEHLYAALWEPDTEPWLLGAAAGQP